MQDQPRPRQARLGGSADLASATALAATTSGAPAIASAEAVGGHGRQGNLHGSAVAHAESNGALGTASTLAQSSGGFEAAGGIVWQVSAFATAPVAGTSVAESRTAVSEPVPDSALVTGLQSAAFATALPSVADVQAALAGNPNVDLNFDVGGTSDTLGLVVLGGAYSDNGSGSSQTYTSRAGFVLDMTPLLGNSQDLLVGLLDPTALGLGFDTLNFQIEMGDTIVTDEVFTNLNDALAYFDDQTLNLGDWIVGLNPDNLVLDIAFMLSLTTDDLGAGFYADFILGNSTAIPIPPAVWLFGSGLLGLIVTARKHKTN